MCNSDRNQDFLFLVFTETNEHIRATDEKSVLMVGSFIALIGVLAALVFGEDVVKWQYFILSVFILIVGHCVYMLQSWYRKWKEHYLRVCQTIRLNFTIDEKQLPFWLRKQKIPIFYSADKLLLILTALINLGILIGSCFLLWLLLKDFHAFRLIIVLLYFCLSIMLAHWIKNRLIDRHRFLHA